MRSGTDWQFLAARMSQGELVACLQITEFGACGGPEMILLSVVTPKIEGVEMIFATPQGLLKACAATPGERRTHPEGGVVTCHG